MKLLTEKIKNDLPELHETDGAEKEYVVKFFTPDANWTWYAFEGEEMENGDWEFFGLVDGDEKELGYFYLSQLQGVRGPLGLPVERDRYYSIEQFKSDNEQFISRIMT